MLTDIQIQALGFQSVGKNVRISERASIYGAGRISLGNNVRIDDYVVISAGSEGIRLGNYIHIACFSSLIGSSLIQMEDFSGLSSRVSVYSSSDDYSGEAMTNPTVPAAFTKVTHAPVHIAKHVIVGAGSVILPGVTLAEGCAVGALSLVTRDTERFMIYSGVPARRIMPRKQKLLELESELRTQDPDFHAS